MKELYYTTQAKKDLKRYKGNPTKMKKLFTVLNMLANLSYSNSIFLLVGTYFKISPN